MLPDNQAEVARLLKAINCGGPAEFFRQSLQNDATEWVRIKLRFAANIGLDQEAATPIIFDTLSEIPAIVAARIERESAERSTRDS
jgi:hypothetical protein